MEKTKVIVSKLKKLILNINMSLLYADSVIELMNTKIDLYSNSESKKRQRKLVRCKIEKERFEIFRDDLEKLKNEILTGVNAIVSKHCGTFTKVFSLYYLENKSVQEICEIEKLETGAVEKIIARLDNDLLAFYEQ